VKEYRKYKISWSEPTLLEHPTDFWNKWRFWSKARQGRGNFASNDKKDGAQLARELYCSISAFAHFVVWGSRLNKLTELLK